MAFVFIHPLVSLNFLKLIDQNQIPSFVSDKKKGISFIEEYFKHNSCKLRNNLRSNFQEDDNHC